MTPLEAAALAFTQAHAAHVRASVVAAEASHALSVAARGPSPFVRSAEQVAARERLSVAYGRVRVAHAALVVARDGLEAAALSVGEEVGV